MLIKGNILIKSVTKTKITKRQKRWIAWYVIWYLWCLFTRELLSGTQAPKCHQTLMMDIDFHRCNYLFQENCIKTSS